VAFTQNQAGDVLTGDVMHSVGTNSNATGRNAINVAIGLDSELNAVEDGAGPLKAISPSGGAVPGMVAYDTFMGEGINHGSAQETYSGEILRVLRQEVGEEAFAEWGLRILRALQQAEVLQHQMLRQGYRKQAEADESRMDGLTSQSKKNMPTWAMCAMRIAGECGCSPQGRRLAEQCARELGKALSELPHERASQSAFLFSLWKASEGVGVLRQALSEIQEIWRPPDVQTKPAYPSLQVRRLTPEEAEVLQGFPRGYTKISDKTADGPRYRALGNSMAVPVMRWIGERIQIIEGVCK
jgi:hypothetical protein